MQLPRCRGLQQLIVWSLAPQEEGQPRGQFQIAEGKCVFCVRGCLDRAEEELWADQDRSDQLLDTRIETTHTSVIEIGHQRINVSCCYGTPERAAREVLSDAPRARLFRLRPILLAGPAHENLSPARCLRHTGRVERALDAHPADHARGTVAATELVTGQEPNEFIQLDTRPLDECDADVVGPCLHLHRNVGEALHDRGACRCAALIDQLEVLGCAE